MESHSFQVVDQERQTFSSFLVSRKRVGMRKEDSGCVCVFCSSGFLNLSLLSSRESIFFCSFFHLDEAQ